MAAHYEYEFEEEFSPLHEYEMEADPFLGKAFKSIGSIAKRAAPLLKKIAPIAARVVAGAIPGVGGIVGPLAGKLTSALTQGQQQELEAILSEASMPTPEYGSVYQESGSPYQEFESPYQEWANPEFESVYQEWANPEFESVYSEYAQPESNGIYQEMEGLYQETDSGAHPEFESGIPHSVAAHQEAMLMELIAYEAAHTPNEAEAEALAGSLVPLAGRSSRPTPPAVRAAIPALARATGQLVGSLRRSPATRKLIPAVSTILGRTNTVLSQAAAQGAPVTPKAAVRTMANQTYKVLSNPTVCIRILIRSGKMRRRPRNGMMP